MDVKDLPPELRGAIASARTTLLDMIDHIREPDMSDDQSGFTLERWRVNAEHAVKDIDKALRLGEGTNLAELVATKPD